MSRGSRSEFSEFTSVFGELEDLYEEDDSDSDGGDSAVDEDLSDDDSADDNSSDEDTSDEDASETSSKVEKEETNLAAESKLGESYNSKDEDFHLTDFIRRQACIGKQPRASRFRQ